MANSVRQTLLRIKLDKSEEKLTSVSGLILVEELARAKGLWQRVDELFPSPGSGRGYKASEFVRPLVWLLSAGGRALEHVRELRAEQQVLRQFGMERLPDAGTIGDWLRRQGESGSVGIINRINQEVIAEYLASQGEELTLDVDATIIESDKRQAQWTYKGLRGYHPVLAYVGEVCVHHQFREGNESPGSAALEFLKECEKRLPEGSKIYLRSDSAYYQAEVITHYSKAGRSFSITAGQDLAVKEAIKLIPEDQWQKFYNEDGVVTDRQIAETVHCMNRTKGSFRLIVLRWQNRQRELFEPDDYRYYAVATNRPESESATEIIWRHNHRGESENWHKELKSGYGMEQMPCGETEANGLFFAIGVLAYDLGVLLKTELLPEEYRRCTVATVRWQVYRIAGKLIRHGRGLILKLKTDGEKLAMLMAVREKCYQIAC